MRYLFLFAIYVGLVAYTITDILNRGEKEPYGIHRILWMVIVVVIPFLGAAAWLFLKFRDRGTRPGTRGPIAPDDDPAYLSWLRDQERRRRRRDGKT